MRNLENYRITDKRTPGAANPKRICGPFLFIQRKNRDDRKEVREVSVLFSDLLLPGWAEGCEAKIGLHEVTCVTGNGDEFLLPCHSADPEIFFSEEMVQISRAKNLCSSCPLQAACLEGALSRSEPCGVWGGELFEGGRVIAEKRGVGRPRIRTLDGDSISDGQSERMDQAS